MNIEELREKAKSGDCVAQTVLGMCYLDGIGTEIDYGQAYRVLSAAAAQGVPRALFNLARMHAEGSGTPLDLAEAIRLYERAELQGVSGADLLRSNVCPRFGCLR